MKNNELKSLFVNTLKKLVDRNRRLHSHNTSKPICSFKILDDESWLHLLLHSKYITVANYGTDMSYATNKGNYELIYINYFATRKDSMTYKFSCNSRKNDGNPEPEFVTNYEKLENGLNQINSFLKMELLKNL